MSFEARDVEIMKKKKIMKNVIDFNSFKRKSIKGGINKMLKKKMVALVLAVSTLMGIMPVSVMADETVRTEDFYVYLNGGSKVSSGSARKAVAGAMYTYTQERPGTSITWVQGVETVNLRGRSINGTQATTLGETSYAGPVYLTYNTGYGSIGSHYKLAVQYASDNPYEKLDLRCTWRP